MANSAEAVGQLLAQSMLMKGERQLLGKKDAGPGPGGYADGAANGRADRARFQSGRSRLVDVA